MLTLKIKNKLNLITHCQLILHKNTRPKWYLTKTRLL